jgi:hypothetical protein
MPVRNKAQSSFLGNARPAACGRRNDVRFSGIMILAMTNADGLAIAMLATILLSFGIIVMLLACIVRNASRRDADVDGLLDEMKQEKKSSKQVKAASGEGQQREAWEKDGSGSKLK